MMDRTPPYLPPDCPPVEPRNPIEAETDGIALAVVMFGSGALLVGGIVALVWLFP